MPQSKKITKKFARFIKSMYFCNRFQSKGSGFSAVGSAHVWGARGRWFESSNPDQKKIQTAVYQQFGFLFLPKNGVFLITFL